jgi:hypothetical protein
MVYLKKENSLMVNERDKEGYRTARCSIPENMREHEAGSDLTYYGEH